MREATCTVCKQKIVIVSLNHIIVYKLFVLDKNIWNHKKCANKWLQFGFFV